MKKYDYDWKGISIIYQIKGLSSQPIKPTEKEVQNSWKGRSKLPDGLAKGKTSGIGRVSIIIQIGKGA